MHTALIVKWREGRGGRAAGRITVCSTTGQAGGGSYMGYRELGEDQSTQEKKGERVQAHMGGR